MSFFESFNSCNCGQKFKKEEITCSSCGRQKYRMSTDPNQEDSVTKYEKDIKKAKNLTKRISVIKWNIERSNMG
jgi:hypothetical protein